MSANQLEVVFIKPMILNDFLFTLLLTKFSVTQL